MSAHAIASKIRRALRNQTGATFTLAQLREMAEWGILVQLSEIEANELWPVKQAPASPQVVDEEKTAIPQKIPRKRRMTPEEGRLFIAELSREL